MSNQLSGAARTRELASIVMRHQARDVLRSRWVIAYALLLVAIGDVLLRLAGNSASALVSLLNITLLLVPVIALILGTAALYGARAFTELLLTQPVPRRALFVGLYCGLTGPLMAATVLGLLLPFLLERALDRTVLTPVLLLLAIAAVLVAIFAALAFLIAFSIRERTKGIAVAMLSWLAFGLVYDGLVLVTATAMRDWPLERGMLVAMAANPIDLARTVLLLRLDVAALTGYTGAVFQHAFGSRAGVLIALALLGLWTAIPLVAGARAFDRRDF